VPLRRRKGRIMPMLLYLAGLTLALALLFAIYLEGTS
jgi:hypothetical protein